MWMNGWNANDVTLYGVTVELAVHIIIPDPPNL